MPQAHDSVLLLCDGAIATLQLNQPQRHNALNNTALQTAEALLKQVAADSSIRVLIVTGSGDKTFCAGAALDEVSSGNLSGKHFDQLCNSLATLPIPVIAALNGSVYGGGNDLALSCDFRLGVHGMKAMIPAAKLGICYPPAGIARLVQRLGLNYAQRMLLACEPLHDEQLLQCQYLSELMPASELPDRTRQLAQTLAANAPLALRAMKQIANAAAAAAVDPEQARALSQACLASQDLREGLAAAAAKRPPRFSGF